MPRATSAEIERDRRILALAARCWDVLTTAELRAAGLTYDAIMRRCRRSFLTRIHRGVYVVARPQPCPEGRLLAAVKACGRGAVASHLSAAWLWGLIDRLPRLPEVTVPGSGARTHAGIRVHRTRRLADGDRAMAKNVPVTSPVRTLLDLAAVLDDRELKRAVRRALADLVTVEELRGAIAGCGRRPGVGRLRNLISPGVGPTRSGLEDVVLDVVVDAGFVHPDVNKPLWIDGRKVVPDLRWPDHRLIVEADSRKWHDNPVARAEDAERQAVLEAHGEQVIRVTWDQATRGRRQTIRRLRRAGAPMREGASAIERASAPG